MYRIIGITMLALFASACETMDLAKLDGTVVTLECPSGSSLEIVSPWFEMGSFVEYPEYQVAQCRNDYGNIVGTGYGFAQQPDGTSRILLSATYSGFHLKETTYYVMPDPQSELHHLDSIGIAPLCGGRFHAHGGVYGVQSRYETPCTEGRKYVFSCEHGVFTRRVPDLAYPGIVYVVQCQDADENFLGTPRLMERVPHADPQWTDVTDEVWDVERAHRDAFRRQMAAWPVALQEEALRIQFELKNSRFASIGLCGGSALSEERDLRVRFEAMFADGRVADPSEGLLLVQLAYRVRDARKRDSDACSYRLTRH